MRLLIRSRAWLPYRSRDWVPFVSSIYIYMYIPPQDDAGEPSGHDGPLYPGRDGPRGMLDPWNMSPI